MRRYPWNSESLLFIGFILLFSSCSGLPLRFPSAPATETPVQQETELASQDIPDFEEPPRDALLEWTDALSDAYCQPANPGSFSSLAYASGAFYSVQSNDPRSVWRLLAGEAEREKIAESAGEDGGVIEALRVNDQWMVMLIFDHPMHVQGWRVEVLNLNTNEQRRLTDNIEAAENIVYHDMELQGDVLYFLTYTPSGESAKQLSTITAFNLAQATQEELLSLESDRFYHQLAVSGRYLMISQSDGGKASREPLPILFYNLETGQLEDLMEISGSYPLMDSALAAWSEQGPNKPPKVFKIFDFKSGLSWPLAIEGEKPSHFDLSAKYLTWIDPSVPTSAFPAVYLMSLDDGRRLTLSLEKLELMPQFPQVRDGKLILGLVEDIYSADASGMICAIPLEDLQALSQPVTETTPQTP